MVDESIFGRGGGERLAAVGGYQCGEKGAAVAMPTFSRKNRIGLARLLGSVSRHPLRLV